MDESLWCISNTEGCRRSCSLQLRLRPAETPLDSKLSCSCSFVNTFGKKLLFFSFFYSTGSQFTITSENKLNSALQHFHQSDAPSVTSSPSSSFRKCVWEIRDVTKGHRSHQQPCRLETTPTSRCRLCTLTCLFVASSLTYEVQQRLNFSRRL